MYINPAKGLFDSIIGLRRALFMCAASCQGGHSDAGYAASEMLGVPFPITMEALRAKAVGEGFDPKDLWSWLEAQRAKSTHAE